MIYRTILVGILLIPEIILAAPVLKGDVNELSSYLVDSRKIVVISGEGKETAEADNAIVSLVVKTKEEKLQIALKKNRNIRMDIRNELIAKGMKDKDISFSKFSSTQEYGWFGDKPTSYTISNEIKITIKDENQLEMIAAIVDKKNEVYFTRTTLEHTGKHQAEDLAQDKALKRILTKKKKYEDELGIKLKAVRVLDEQIVRDRPMPIKAPRADKAMSIMSESYEPSGVRSSSFGEIIYRAYTRVEFVVIN